AFWLLLRFSKVTRCKSGTNSGRYLNNGYVLRAKSRTNFNTSHGHLWKSQSIEKQDWPWC
ncbi:hypothetical protein, partial [uncultured Pseudomonas sp.]|uniref:hypothetical protein n=1 Tax=uncultured Pseudomonas sp. TaxID=114707 RepID=UPI0025E28E97